MRPPRRLDFTPEEIDQLIDRLNNKCLQEEDYLLLTIRGDAGLFARQKGIPLEELAKAFKRDGSTISRLAQQFSQKQAYNEDLQNQYQQLEMLVTRFAVTHA